MGRIQSFISVLYFQAIALCWQQMKHQVTPKKSDNMQENTNKQWGWAVTSMYLKMACRSMMLWRYNAYLHLTKKKKKLTKLDGFAGKFCQGTS